jgi:DNA repair photolyase
MSAKPIQNPPNPWQSNHVEWIDAPPPAELKVYEEHARSIVSVNSSPDVGFSYSVNPYRGCFHACAYCYARPSHQYLDFGAGTDFDRKIVVKVNADEKLIETFMKPSWQGEVIAFSGNTDCYQPLEANYELTRRCLSACRRFRNPVGIITKSALIRRDIDILRDLASFGAVRVNISIPFSDKRMARRMEPGAPSPAVRFATIQKLADAGIPVGVAVAPIIPGLNDSQIVEVLEQAAEAGADRAFRVLLRLPAEVKQVFSERLEDTYPDRFDKVLNGMREVRGGKLNDSTFGQRMRGKGPRWEAIANLFDSTVRRLGLNLESENDVHDSLSDVQTFRRPGDQLELFG